MPQEGGVYICGASWRPGGSVPQATDALPAGLDMGSGPCRGWLCERIRDAQCKEIQLKLPSSPFTLQDGAEAATQEEEDVHFDDDYNGMLQTTASAQPAAPPSTRTDSAPPASHALPPLTASAQPTAPQQRGSKHQDDPAARVSRSS